MFKRHTLLVFLGSQIIGFDELYEHDETFVSTYVLCLKKHFDEFYLFNKEKLYIPQGSIKKVLIQESHGGGLMSHYRVNPYSFEKQILLVTH